jgi:prefoldin subunit 5
MAQLPGPPPLPPDGRMTQEFIRWLTQFLTGSNTVAGQLTSLQQQVTTLNASVSTLNASVAALTTTVNSLSTSVTSLTATVNSLSTTVSGHTTSINTLNTSVTQLQAKYSTNAVVPLTGFTLTIPASTGLQLLQPAGALASGTLTLPASPSDGFEQQILSTQTVTALTVAPNAGQTVAGTATFTLAPFVQAVFRWRASSSSWSRLQ